MTSEQSETPTPEEVAAAAQAYGAAAPVQPAHAPTGDADTPDAGTADEGAADGDPEGAPDLSPESMFEQVTAERDEFKDHLQRLQAEFDNFRKRTARDLAAARDTGKTQIMRALLEVLDDVDRMREAVDDADDATKKGVTQVADKLLATLGNHGLVREEESGVAFDPARHEAVQHQAGEGGDPTVAAVMRPGYLLGDTVLRPAMVAVRD